MEKHITYNNKSIYFNVEGEGEPVILLHGVPADGRLWHHQAAFLNDRYKLIIPDLPGSGKSELPDNLTIDLIAGMLKDILESEGISEAVIIGHSMGGYVALAFADKYPETIKALGLFHSTAYSDSEDKKNTRKKNIDSIEMHGSIQFIKKSIPGLFSDGFKKDHKLVVEDTIEKFKNTDAATLAACQKAMMDRPDRRKILEEIVKPVLFIIGQDDSVVPFKESMEQCHIPALSYIHILKNSGHMGMLEEAEKTNEILVTFLENVWQR